MKLYTEQMQSLCDALETALPQYLPAVDTPQGEAARAMCYACLDGGKRLRGVLTLEFCRVLCGDGVKAMPFAAAIEMMHAYSLVHDDLPCMDNSPLRRGKPSTHAKYGETTALLAGDGLQCLAFETMLRPEVITCVGADRVAAAAGALARASGIDGMVGGQAIDLSTEGTAINLPLLETLQRKKTGALLCAACVMGAIVGGADEEQQKAAVKYGLLLGRAFQIVDDVLDVISTAEQLGKPIGADAAVGKNTFVSLLGLEASQKLAGEHTENAVQALACFGERAEGLKQLAQNLLSRMY